MAAKSDLYVMTEQAKRGLTPNLGSFPAHVAVCSLHPNNSTALLSPPLLGHSQLVLTSKPSQPFIPTSSHPVFSDIHYNFAPHVGLPSICPACGLQSTSGNVVVGMLLFKPPTSLTAASYPLLHQPEPRR